MIVLGVSSQLAVVVAVAEAATVITDITLHHVLHRSIQYRRTEPFGVWGFQWGTKNWIT